MRPSPARPSSVTTGRPAAAQAFIPPARLCTRTPGGGEQVGGLARAVAGAADGDHRQLRGERGGIEPAEREVPGLGRVAGGPLLGLADVEQERAAGDEQAAAAGSRSGEPGGRLIVAVPPGDQRMSG